jgi:hypothetical protein
MILFIDNCVFDNIFSAVSTVRISGAITLSSFSGNSFTDCSTSSTSFFFFFFLCICYFFLLLLL